MTSARLMKLMLLAAALALAIRVVDLTWTSHGNAKIAGELCAFVGNDMETGSLRNVFEGIDAGLRRSGIANACILVTDNGRSFSPDCMKADLSYQSVICKAEANKGVQASVFFPSQNFISYGLFLTFMAICALLFSLSLALEKFAKAIVEEFSTEITTRLSISTVAARPSRFLRRMVDWLLLKSGISQSIRSRAAVFQMQMKDYEAQIALETTRKVKKEQEIQSTREYIDKVKSIRHDIRSPLSSLQSARERLGRDNEVDRTLFSAIRKIQVMLDQLDEVDRVAEAPALLVVEVVADDFVFELKPKFQQGKGVNLTYRYDYQQLSPVTAGREDFTRAIDNLLQNAFDAVGKDGEVRLSVSSTAAECVIEVEDNGCGIPIGFEEKLFSRGATIGKVNGIGLGLFHTKRNVESWGGTIGFERLAQGTKFFIRLPLTQTGVQFTGLSPGAKLKIIDDDASVPRALRNGGFEILETADTFAAGKSLLEKHQGGEITVLVDYRLDGNHFGTDLISEYRGCQGLILCTNDFDDEDLIKKAKALGVKIVPKPICYSVQALGY